MSERVSERVCVCGVLLLQHRGFRQRPGSHVGHPDRVSRAAVSICTIGAVDELPKAVPYLIHNLSLDQARRDQLEQHELGLLDLTIVIIVADPEVVDGEVVHDRHSRLFVPLHLHRRTGQVGGGGSEDVAIGQLSVAHSLLRGVPQIAFCFLAVFCRLAGL